MKVDPMQNCKFISSCVCDQIDPDGGLRYDMMKEMNHLDYSKKRPSDMVKVLKSMTLKAVDKYKAMFEHSAPAYMYLKLSVPSFTSVFPFTNWKGGLTRPQVPQHTIRW